MDNQQVTLQSPKKKTLLLPILAASLAVGGALIYFFVAFLLPAILHAVDLGLCIFGIIPGIGLISNILSFLLSLIYLPLSLINPIIWVITLSAVIAGIVIGIIALVRSRSNPIGTLGTVLSIIAIALGVLLILVMIAMLIISIITSIISFIFSIIGLILDIFLFILPG